MFSSYQYTWMTQQCFQTIQIMTQQCFHTVNIMTQQCFQIVHSMIQQFFQIVHIMTQQNSLTLLSLKTIQISSLQCFKANDCLILRSFKTIPSLTLSCFRTMYLHLSSSWLIYSTWWFLKIIYLQYRIGIVKQGTSQDRNPSIIDSAEMRQRISSIKQLKNIQRYSIVWTKVQGLAYTSPLSCIFIQIKLQLWRRNNWWFSTIQCLISSWIMNGLHTTCLCLLPVTFYCTL